MASLEVQPPSLSESPSGGGLPLHQTDHPQALQVYAQQDASAADQDEASVVSDGDDDEDEAMISPAEDVPERHLPAQAAPEPSSKAITLPVEVWERILINVDPAHMHTMSQISQQHQAITRNTFFRARYFYARHKRCQAIYYASCRSKLFTAEVLQALLSLGAILSRYFCQSILQRHLGVGRPRGHSKWGTSLSTGVLLAVSNEGHRLYGEGLRFGQSDGNDIKSWADNLSRASPLTATIRAKFIEGRFALFTDDDSIFQSPYGSTSPLANVVSHHPEVLQLLMDNGYEFEKDEQNKILVCICQKYADDEELLYERLDSLLLQFPDWPMQAQSRFVSDYVTTPNSSNYAPVPATEAGRALLLKHDGIGPIKKPLKVMKRLADEGRAFLDLDEVIIDLFSDDCYKNERRSRKDAAPSFRILAHLFPEITESFKVEIATALVCHFEHEFKEASPVVFTRGLDKLFKLLDELELDQGDWKNLVIVDYICFEKFTIAAVKRGYFGAVENMDKDSKTSLLSELAVSCIDGPMSGHHLEAIEAAAKVLFSSEHSVSKRQKKVSTIMARALEEALLQWQFNLDTLKPDRKHAVEHKLRSPIAWLTKGSYTVTNNSYSPSCISNPDPYDLYPYAPRPHHGNELMELTFAYPQPDLGFRMVEVDAADDVSSTMATKQKEEESKAGWKHLGHIDDLYKFDLMADDSGVVIVEPGEQSVVGVEDEELPATPQEEIAATAGTAPTGKTLIRQDITTGKIGSLSSVIMKVVRTTCAACIRSNIAHNCGYHMPHHHQAKEMAAVLPLFLPADSPALRDVLLSHALVNGNVEVIKELMGGQYGEEANVTGEEEVKPLSKTSKARLGQPDKPVLPTLAHWRIMQAIERKPVEQFVNRILAGAPFKRGYVQSSEGARTKEKDSDARREWYQKTAHKDDRPMTSLFREKKRLEEFDKSAKKKKQTGKRRTKAKSKSKDGDEAMESFIPAKSASQVAEASKEKTSARTHLRRSATRKPVRYTESASISSDEDEDDEHDKVGQRKVRGGDIMDEDHEEMQVLEMIGSASRSKRSAEQMSDGDLFGRGSDLSDLSSDVEDCPSRDKKEKAESETDDDDDDEIKDSITYGFKDKDAPMVTLETEDVVQTMSLHSLYCRCKSLKLWLDHLHLLLWFERRKERLMKEKSAKARAAGKYSDRVSKSKFSLGLSEYIRRMESDLTMMQEALEPALKARRLAMTQKKKNVDKIIPKVESSKEDEEAAVKAKAKTDPPRRKRIRLSDVILDPSVASTSTSRKKRKHRHEAASTAA